MKLKNNTMKRIFLSLVFSALGFLWLNAQIHNPVTWNHSTKHVSGDTYEITFTATIEDGWHMYGLNMDEGGPIPTSFSFENNEVEPKSLTTKEKAKKKYDDILEVNVELFSHQVNFMQTVVAKGNSAVGYIEYMACNDVTCTPPLQFDFDIALEKKAVPANKKEEKVEVKVENKPGIKTKEIITEEVEVKAEVKAESPLKLKTIEMPSSVNKSNDNNGEAEEEELNTVAKSEPAKTNDNDDETPKNLIALFFIAFVAGFGALLTPCVYPMIPMTVSFFMKDGQSKGKAIFNGVAYGVSIVLIYTFVGLIMGLLKIDLVRMLSSHWAPNVIFFLIFIALAASFFGMFELVLPSSLANKVDQKAEKGGVVGPFFMALATAIISFSCTGPIVGWVLGSAMQGDIQTPVVGMFGFSLSFALPFTLLAIFPSMMNKMPKSGGWLNAVKVFFAFIMLAFSMVFLVNIGFEWLSREIVIAINVIIFILLGFYLLGKIKFSHDSDVPHVSVGRLLLSIGSFSLSLYLILGLLGKPMGALEPFLPAATESSTLLTSASNSTVKESGVSTTAKMTCTETPTYSDKLHLPHGLKGYYDYEEGLACAAEQGKPVFLDFVGHTCKNCKKMYADVWSDSRVQKLLSENFITIAMYVDDRTELPEEKWYTSTADGKVKKTLGRKNGALQIDMFGSNALPMYAVIDPTTQEVATDQKIYTYNSDVEALLTYLKEAL